MKIYLAGIRSAIKMFPVTTIKPYAMESFYYMQQKDEWFDKAKIYFKEFIIDSGAFTFMKNAKSHTGNDFDTYTEAYGAFILKHKIDKFLELDIDSLVGLSEVERLRKKLEKITNRQCIPVWHKSRGLNYWKKICKTYKYVAIGGIATREIKKGEYDIFIPLLKIAKECNCKVHGLGFTYTRKLNRYKFYSVDSSSWLYGRIGGFIYGFKGDYVKKITQPKRRLNTELGMVHNYNEWLKFSEYAEVNL